MIRRLHVVCFCVLIAACGGTATSLPTVDREPAQRDRLVADGVDVASCAAAVNSYPDEIRLHVAPDTPVEYDSNPPCGGPHYPSWAAYGATSTPVDRRYYVHNLEHGAVVLAYRCADARGCPEIANRLAALAESLPADPICEGVVGVRNRIVITPDPELDAPIAASAWGWTYEAACLDEGAIAGFIADHYGQGPESNCTNGISF